MVGRSRSLLGPYVDERELKMVDGGGRLVLMSNQRWRGTGHNSLLQTERGDWLVYHAIDAEHPYARILQIRKLEWEDGWPVASELVTHRQGSAATSLPVGRWDHLVDGRDHYDIFLEPSGLITGGPRGARWEQDGDQLLLKWPDRRAPGGVWIDRARLSRDRRSYSGENQQGVPVQGHLR